MKFYVVGNPLVALDRLPLRLLPKLKQRFPQITFCLVDPNENFPPPGERKLTLIDTVQGISAPLRFELNDLESRPKTPISPHDYGLLMHLLLLKKTGRIDNVIIFGVPAGAGVKVADKLVKLIAAFCRSTSS